MASTRKSLSLFAAAIVQVLAACAGSSSVAPAAQSAGTASIDGRVTGGPTAILVEVSGTTAATITDASGNFALVGVPAGASALHFSGAGVDATLSIQVLIDSEHRSLSVTLSGSKATEQHEQTGSEFHGKVEALSAPNLTVAGRTVVTSSATTFTKNGAAATFADIAVGDLVEVHGTLQADGTVNATSIEDGEGAPAQDSIFFTATLSKIAGNTVTVGDIPVVVSSTTVITKGDKTITLADLSVGDRLLVKGTLQPGPSVNAIAIRVLVPDVDPDVHVAGKIQAIDTTAKTITIAGIGEDGESAGAAPTTTTVSYDDKTKFGGFGDPKSAADLKVGDMVIVAGSRTASGILALAIVRLPPLQPPPPNVVVLHGTIKSIAADGTSLTVTVPADGGASTDVVVAVNAGTVFGGAGEPKSLADFKVSDLVVVKASKAADGSLTALGVFRLPLPPPPVVELTGFIGAIASDGKSFTLQGPPGSTIPAIIVEVDASTVYGGAGDPKSLADFKVADRVEVKAQKQADGSVLALGVFRLPIS